MKKAKDFWNKLFHNKKCFGYWNCLVARWEFKEDGREAYKKCKLIDECEKEFNRRLREAKKNA